MDTRDVAVLRNRTWLATICSQQMSRVKRVALHVMFASGIGFTLLANGAVAQSATRAHGAPAQSATRAHGPLPKLTSDPKALFAMQHVLTVSGGLAAWQGVRSMSETFSITNSRTNETRTLQFLDDWSTSSSRYWRKDSRKSDAPKSHDGLAKFDVNVSGRKLTIPEFDQGRLLATHLPAAAIETMLRRDEYVFRLSGEGRCIDSASTCIDVLRVPGKDLPERFEQQWTISQATGLPTEVLIALPAVGGSVSIAWKRISFLKFESQSGLLLPTQMQTSPTNAGTEVWRLNLSKLNPDFSGSLLEQGVSQ